jgi:ankyrin repeat protein
MAGVSAATKQLWAAAAAQDVAAVEAALRAGALVNGARASDGAAALHLAASRGVPALTVDAVRVLLGAGAAVNQARGTGAAPLYIAAQDGHVEVVRALLGAGAAVNQANTVGSTPLYVAAEKGHVEVVRALLAAGADPLAADEDNRTPLYVVCTARGAVMTDREAICSLLTAAKASARAAFAAACCADSATASVAARGWQLVRSLSKRDVGPAYLACSKPAAAAIVPAGTAAVVQVTPRPIPADAAAATLRHLDALQEVRGGVVAGRL